MVEGSDCNTQAKFSSLSGMQSKMALSVVNNHWSSFFFLFFTLTEVDLWSEIHVES